MFQKNQLTIHLFTIHCPALILPRIGINMMYIRILLQIRTILYIMNIMRGDNIIRFSGNGLTVNSASKEFHITITQIIHICDSPACTRQDHIPSINALTCGMRQKLSQRPRALRPSTPMHHVTKSLYAYTTSQLSSLQYVVFSQACCREAEESDRHHKILGQIQAVCVALSFAKSLKEDALQTLMFFGNNFIRIFNQYLTKSFSYFLL